MPIEIRELKVTGFINKNLVGQNQKNPGLSKDELVKLKKSIVNECTSKVMEIMERKARR